MAARCVLSQDVLQWGMAANPFGAHQAGELSLATTDGRIGSRFGVPYSNPAHALFALFPNGPWSWQSNALSLNFPFRIRWNLASVSLA